MVSGPVRRNAYSSAIATLPASVRARLFNVAVLSTA
jgi:hypothetical protein